jgi:protein-tyrosine-phosphatase
MTDQFPYKAILIVCSVNTARSPMAEGYLRYVFEALALDIDLHSAGVASNARDGMLISLDARLVMQEEGIKLASDSRSIDLKRHPDLLKGIDLILTLTEKHKSQVLELEGDIDADIFTFREFAGETGDIKDPSMKETAGFRKAREEIKDCIIKGLQQWFEKETIESIIS